ncbi:hypothetical protein [Alteriqipengyuania lutimaris]|uniref:Uncharacterized protein n=1 Tax=Alteriqipengyuania lutimaris TaxID=1538146 RepID=A0A395LJR2_9SPHN|nr:hypothetical protein [Alteriqipengyuania lutimaris]MBB3034023.1 hypothetical protein [Alteriqipengyuania lutimaris]RDS77031.1 hypothetical protein DL238_05000 [Alteriqipengyuania lutimaris]
MTRAAAIIAAQETTRRIAMIDEAEDAARIDAGQARTLRACWLAIAAACGAHRELPQLVGHTKLAYPPHRAGEPATFHYAPEDFIHRSAWQGELRRALATARGKARADTSEANCRRVSVLLIIAIAAGVVPLPARERPPMEMAA